MKPSSLGSISHGTMREADLIPSFTRHLEWLTQAGRNDRTDRQTKLIAEADAVEDFDSEEAGYILEALFDALDEFSPEGAYFGANEGDGSDYGYWMGDDA